jgi:hypothetical protein
MSKLTRAFDKLQKSLVKFVFLHGNLNSQEIGDALDEIIKICDKCILIDNKEKVIKSEYVNFGGFRWKKIGVDNEYN